MCAWLTGSREQAMLQVLKSSVPLQLAPVPQKSGLCSFNLFGPSRTDAYFVWQRGIRPAERMVFRYHAFRGEFGCCHGFSCSENQRQSYSVDPDREGEEECEAHLLGV